MHNWLLMLPDELISTVRGVSLVSGADIVHPVNPYESSFTVNVLLQTVSLKLL
jgi:hypothetical protein